MRVSAAKAFLKPALARPNLTVMTHAQVKRLRLDGRRIPGQAHQHAVAVGKGEHRVEMHRCAQLGHCGNDHAFRRALLEQRRRELADALTRRAFAHSDQHVALADRHDVAALEGHRPVVARFAVGVTQPDLVVRAGERRMELVHRGGQQCLLAAGRPVHRVQRDTVEDP